MSTPNSTQEQVNKLAQQLEAVSYITSRFDFNEFGHVRLDQDFSAPSIRFYPNDNNRESVLALLAEQVGAEDWTRRLAYSKEYYHWHKTIDGVCLYVYNAEPIPSPVKPNSVSPSDFPLLLDSHATN